MRHMTNEHGDTVKVIEHIILSNMWEYYILEAANEDGIAFALVVGDYTEMGSIYTKDIAWLVMEDGSKERLEQTDRQKKQSAKTADLMRQLFGD